jgi:hypothetical protein
MTEYTEHKINLSDNQKKNLGKALRNKTSLKIRLSNNNLNGTIPILLTKSQKSSIDKSIKNKTGLELSLSQKQINSLMKHGGFLPLLPLILGGISAIGSLAAGGSQIAKAVNQAKTNAKELSETKRHNEMIENKLISGKSLYSKCKSCNGKGLFLGKSQSVR